MAASDDLKAIARSYVTFAVNIARGRSELYEEFALAIADTPEVLGFIATLPADRRQPHLFLAAIRQLRGVPQDVNNLIEIARQEHSRIRRIMLSRTVQTNEPARCSALVPLLA